MPADQDSAHLRFDDEHNGNGFVEVSNIFVMQGDFFSEPDDILTDFFPILMQDKSGLHDGALLRQGDSPNYSSVTKAIYSASELQPVVSHSTYNCFNYFPHISTRLYVRSVM